MKAAPSPFSHIWRRRFPIFICFICFWNVWNLVFLVLLVLLTFPSSLFAVEFVDVTEAAGIHFRHIDGRSGRKYFLETLGSGAAWFDYDNDGDPDLYLVNGTSLPGYQTNIRPTNRLYENRRDGTFVDVTEKAGVGDTGYGHGCCVGDYDNDGDLDLYVTNYGANVLYRNNGDGTFTDVTFKTNVGNIGNIGNSTKWSTSSAFADYDCDGDLDLYVANYVEFNLEANPWCGLKEEAIRAYCNPNNFSGQPDTLYRNNGNGTFTDVTQESGVYNPEGKGLGVVWGDYDNDGYRDLYVANDATPNFLYHNRGDGSFEEVGFEVGVAVSENGVAENGMGTAFGDYDNDGRLDLTVTNFASQMNTLYHNDGDGFFSDVTVVSRMGPATYPFLGWATEFVDYDNDGWVDIFVANGHLHDNIQELRQDGSYTQRNLWFRNNHDGTFTEISQELGPGMRLEEVSRGAAFADYDLDGDIDVVVTNSSAPARLLRNEGGNDNNWLAVRLVQTSGSSEGVGARVTVYAGDLVQTKELQSGSGYLSQNELKLLFGLGEHKDVDKVEVRWVRGKIEQFTNIPTNQSVVIIEGMGNGE